MITMMIMMILNDLSKRTERTINFRHKSLTMMMLVVMTMMLLNVPWKHTERIIDFRHKS